MRSGERAQVQSYESQKQAFFHAHRLAVADLCSQAFFTRLETVMNAYDEGKLDDELPYIRICMATPHVDTTRGYTHSQQEETESILGEIEIPIVMIAPPSYYQRFPFRPTIQAASIPALINETLFWIKNGEDSLFSGTIINIQEPVKTIRMVDIYQKQHSLPISTIDGPIQAVRFHLDDSYLPREYDRAIPSSIYLYDELRRFIKSDGSVMSRRDVEEYFSSRDARTLDLSDHNFFTNFTSEHQHTSRNRLLELLDSPDAFLNYAGNIMRSLRQSNHPETLQPFYRGKILTRTDDFRIDVTESDMYWHIHMPNIDISEWPLPALAHSRSPENDGSVVIQITKHTVEGNIRIQTWHTVPEDDAHYALAEEGPGIIGKNELITLLAVMEKDIEMPLRPAPLHVK